MIHIIIQPHDHLPPCHSLHCDHPSLPCPSPTSPIPSHPSRPQRTTVADGLAALHHDDRLLGDQVNGGRRQRLIIPDHGSVAGIHDSNIKKTEETHLSGEVDAEEARALHLLNAISLHMRIKMQEKERKGIVSWPPLKMKKRVMRHEKRTWFSLHVVEGVLTDSTTG